jgi:SAM-dependent methyltransferase
MSSNQSYINHNAEYEQDSAFEREKIAHKKDEKFLYQLDIPHGDILDKHDFNTAVDIGCGTGWLVNHLVEDRKYKKVYAIEPSQAAIDIAKQLYPERKEVKYIVGFSDKELPKIKLETPTFFSTMCCLAHLEDDDVVTILKAIDKIAPVGSIWSASEPWGDFYHRECWNIRPPEWWSDTLSDWEFEFYSDYEITDPSGRFKGFTAIKT